MRPGRLTALLCVMLLLSHVRATAAECALHSSAQSIARLWICALAADTTTKATQGDLRYNNDTKRVQVYNGTSWANLLEPETPTGTGFVHVTSGVEDAAAVLVTLTSSTEVAPNQGTTTTVLHGNASGQASWAAVSLSADVTGIVGDANGGTGSDTTTAAANRVFVTTGSAYSPFAIPDCDDTGGQHLNYNTTGPAFSCGTTSSTPPGGSDTQVQFNDGGSFGGDAEFVWDKTDGSLAIGPDAVPGGTALINAHRDINDGVVINVRNEDLGATSHPAFQAISHPEVTEPRLIPAGGHIAMRAHANARTSTQCGGLSSMSDVVSVNGAGLNLCALTTQPIYFSNGNTHRAEVTTGGLFRVLDWGSKPTCDSGVQGATWFDAGTPDTYEACTKDASSTYAWRSLITPALVKLTADRTNSSNPAAYADVTGLSFAVAAGVDYAFDCTLVYQSAATTTGIGIAVNGPSATYVTYSVVVYQAAVGASGTDNSNETSVNTYDGMTPTTSVNAANTNYYAHLRGVLSNGGSPGTLIVRFMNEVNSSQVTIRKGSWCTFG